MREIKFRGKRSDNGEWVYGDLIHSGTDTTAILELDAPCLEAVTDVVPDTVGQFTGLHDKNSNEIYEGDIVKQTWGSPHFGKLYLYKVVGFENESRNRDWLFDGDWINPIVEFVKPL